MTEPTLGLIFIAPGLAALFAVAGALLGFVASLVGYAVFVLTGGRIGSGRIKAANPISLKAMTSPPMVAFSVICSLGGTYAGIGWWFNEWDFVAQMKILSVMSFDIQSAGPMVAILGAMVGMGLGLTAARPFFPPPPPEPDTPAYRVFFDDPWPPPAPPPPSVRRNRFLLRQAACLVVGAVGVWLSLGAMLKDFAPAAVSGEIASWWAPPVNEQIAIGGPTGGNGGTGATTATAEPTAWPTYRGSVARTGSLDGRDGPAKPDILWTYECKPAQVLASPATLGGFVFTGGTDGLTGGNLYVLRASKPAGDAKQLARRTKVGLPVYSPPAIRDGLVVVGEGLHQHKKTLLRCLSLADGSTKWELAVPSHLESGPAVEGGRVFTGAGDEGVLCVSLTDLARAAGKDELGDDVAAEPKVVWRRRHSDADGKRTMHADTSPAVVGDSVVIGSGRFFEPDVGTEVGDRAVVCLSAADGAPRWRTELPFNPWGSPAVAGTGESALVLVGCSSERFEADKLAVAKGEVVALSLRNGSVKWRLDAPGGVLSSVAVVAAGTPSASSAVFCRGDGSVVCVGLDGSPRWTAKPGAGLMAGPTVAGRYVYAADVKASVHCLTVADGRPVWSLDLAAKLKNPGQVIGSPAAAAGRLFLGTDGGYVVCIGTE